MALHSVMKALTDPGLVKAWLAAHLRPAMYPQRMTRLARQSGLRRPVFLISFDCDTDEDSSVLGALHERLRSAGLSPGYAACGEVMQAATGVYRSLARDGAELLNHGFRRHAERNPATGDVRSTFFYDDNAPEIWRDDLRRGHEAIADITGRPPRGFRTPHFGTFESPPALDALWRELASLNYVYSSSTRPLAGWRFGPAFRRHGIVELPVSGCLGQPTQIVDSWGLARAGGSSLPLISALRSYLGIMAKDTPLLLNVYLDPADIALDDSVHVALASLAPYDRGGFAGAIRELEV